VRYITEGLLEGCHHKYVVYIFCLKHCRNTLKFDHYLIISKASVEDDFHCMLYTQAHTSEGGDDHPHRSFG
jgi:hypothetical protein